MHHRYKFQISKLLKEAAVLLRDPVMVNRLMVSASGIWDANKQKFSHLKDDFDIALRALSAYKKGVYKKIPLRSILMIIASLIYFVNPLDLVPDFILGAGYLDDLALIAYCFGIIRKDLREFEEWEKATPKAEGTTQP
jgi:uncharacterized membrane protein YkvA (DUF1232 family)